MTAPAPVPDGTTPPAEAVEAAQGALGWMLNEYDKIDADGMEWHECDGCPFQPGPCACSGKPWAKRELAEFVAAAVVAALEESGWTPTSETGCAGCSDLPERDRATEVKVRGEAMTQERLGENIRRAIQAAGMTQKEVAERAEIDPTALSKIVTGKRRVSSLELALICTATGSDVLGLLEAEPIHGPSYRAGLEEGARWAALREGGRP